MSLEDQLVDALEQFQLVPVSMSDTDLVVKAMDLFDTPALTSAVQALGFTTVLLADESLRITF